MGAQAALLLALGWPARGARPTGRTRRAAAGALFLAGATVAASGSAELGVDLRPSPLPPPGARLRTTGAYGRVRHPIYAGLLLMAAARGLASTSRRHRLAAAGLGGLLTIKAVTEERLLAEDHPEYADYARRVPRFVPRLVPQRCAGPRGVS